MFHKKEKAFIGYYTLSVSITYLGIISSLVGFYFAFNVRPTIAVICLIIAGICDMFDGKVARMCKRDDKEKEFGIQIDSLADTISFIIFPIIISYTLGMDKWYFVIIYCLFAICGVSRLGYFNINANKNKPVKEYSGLPVTATAIIFPLLYLVTFKMIPDAYNILYGITFSLVAFLFVFNFKIPKPTKNTWYIICSILAIIAILFFIFKELNWLI